MSPVDIGTAFEVLSNCSEFTHVIHLVPVLGSVFFFFCLTLETLQIREMPELQLTLKLIKGEKQDRVAPTVMVWRVNTAEQICLSF